MNDKPKRVRRTKSQMAKARAQANLDTLVAVKLGEARAAKATPSQRLGRPKVHADRAAYRREWMRRHRAAVKAQTAPRTRLNTAQ